MKPACVNCGGDHEYHTPARCRDLAATRNTHPDFEREPSEQMKLEAVADTYAAVQRLADECARVLAQPEWTRESLLAFVEQSKQRLNVVALAVPFIGVRK